MKATSKEKRQRSRWDAKNLMKGYEPNYVKDLKSLRDEDNPTEDIHVNYKGLTDIEL